MKFEALNTSKNHFNWCLEIHTCIIYFTNSNTPKVVAFGLIPIQLPELVQLYAELETAVGYRPFLMAISQLAIGQSADQNLIC